MITSLPSDLLKFWIMQKVRTLLLAPQDRLIMISYDLYFAHRWLLLIGRSRRMAPSRHAHETMHRRFLNMASMTDTSAIGHSGPGQPSARQIHGFIA